MYAKPNELVSFKKLFRIVCISIILHGCELNEDTNAVVTEDVIFVGSETARFAGRIVGSDGTINEHGFEISQSEDFVDKVVIENGSPESLGLYIGLSEGLASNQEYFVRAFVASSKSVTYGQSILFRTLSPESVGIRPSIAVEGDEVKILVKNLTSDAEIFFGGQPAEVLKVQFESVATVLVPSIASEVIVPVSVRMNGVTLDLGTFEYVIGNWRDESLSFPEEGINIFEPVYSQTESGFMLGLGYDQSITFNYQRIWYLDFDSFEWTEIPYSGPGVRDPFRSENYFGNGRISNMFLDVEINNEFYFLDGEGVTLQGSTPFSLYKALAFQIKDDLYVYGGYKGLELNNIVYRYAEGEWEELGTHPIIPPPLEPRPYLLDTVAPPIISEIPNFVVDDRAFIIHDGVVWEFNTSTLGFEEHDRVPITNCIRGVTQVMNGKVYIGICQGIRQEFYEYDPINKIWKEKNKLPVSSHKYNVASFAYDNRIYVILNQLDGLNRIDPRQVIIYSINPDEI